MKNICIIGASGEPGQYMMQHVLVLDYQFSVVIHSRQTKSALRYSEVNNTYSSSVNKGNFQ